MRASAQAQRGRPGTRPAVACLGLDGLGEDPNPKETKAIRRLTIHFARGDRYRRPRRGIPFLGIQAARGAPPLARVEPDRLQPDAPKVTQNYKTIKSAMSFRLPISKSI